MSSYQVDILTMFYQVCNGSHACHNSLPLVSACVMVVPLPIFAADGDFCTCHFWALKTVPIHITMDGRKYPRTWRISLLKRVVFFCDVSQLVCPHFWSMKSMDFFSCEDVTDFYPTYFCPDSWMLHFTNLTSKRIEHHHGFSKIWIKKVKKIPFAWSPFCGSSYWNVQFFHHQLLPKKETHEKFRTWFPTGGSPIFFGTCCAGMDLEWSHERSGWLWRSHRKQGQMDGDESMRGFHGLFFFKRGDWIERKREQVEKI